MLESSSLDALLAGLGRSRQFDHVILDSPPTLQVADSLILATRADVTILVVRAGMTSRDSLSDSVARLRQGRIQIAGAVFNAVSDRSRYYEHYYRAYGHDAGAPDESRGERKGIRSRVQLTLSLSSKKGKQGRRNVG